MPSNRPEQPTNGLANRKSHTDEIEPPPHFSTDHKLAQMRLGDSETYIDIDADEPVAANMPGAGDVRLRVSVHVSGFDGDQRGVWVRRNSAERFISDLYAMARGERDDAMLMSPSNRELTLKFTRPMRSHALLEGELKRTGPGAPATISSSVVFAIYIDAEKLGELAETYDEAWLGPDKAADKKH